MNKLNEMMKRKKDGGFTLIELMIVIAVIGILAIVLVPKVGSVKTQAKTAGIDTNIRLVQGFVQANITSWSNATTPLTAATETEVGTLAPKVTGAMTDLVNPMNSGSTLEPLAAGYTPPATGVAGQIYVDTTDWPTKIMIKAYDSKGALIPEKQVDITP